MGEYVAFRGLRQGFARVRLEIRDCKRRRRLVGRVRCVQLSCSTLWGSIDRCHVWLGFTTGRDVSYVCQRRSCESAGPERTHACFYSNRDVARKVDAFETRSGLNPESDPSNPESRV